MRLIDADELNFGKYKGIPIIGDILIGLNDVAKELKAAPTIDAVPVVRCKDCKKWEADGAYEFDIDGAKRMWGVCSNSLHHCKDNHFCSYGERREDNNEFCNKGKREDKGNEN